ncbi:MAG: acyl-CoA synthetase [Proteobacteria bacterium]|nr:acyl-CoA synthetase [Pseudomonadota bacterium]MBU1386686.1 acyl-CoA synthetase [Pseudomonadota bacterium]MBU1543297.1 acyl-CoA synthetase [Pseudomonadota bacterium]MBU2483128.1 acyl-CoA synthetase [Pseudomonadota bacterium]
MANSSSNKPADQAINEITTYEKQALGQRFPVTNTYQLIQQTKHKFGKNFALAQLYTAEKDEMPQYLTFDQFTRKTRQMAGLLKKLGVKRNDAVTILLPTLMENHIAFWGSQAVAIANPINHFLDADLICDIMNEVNSKILITLAPKDSLNLSKKASEIIAKVPGLTHVLLTTDRADKTVDIQEFKNLCLDPLNMGSEIQILDFSQALEEQADTSLPEEMPINSTDTAIYFHTGGTTGKPKIAMLSHASVSFVAQVYADFNHHHGPSASLNALPLFHVFGTIAASLAVFLQGRCVVMMTPTGFRNPNVVKNWWHFVEYFKVAWFATVPTIMNALLEIPVGNHNIDCLKYVNSGSAPLSVNLKNTFARKFNVTVVSGYGMTESSCLISRCLYGYDTPADTVGLRIPYTRLITAKIIGNTIESICEPGEPGVVLVKGPNIFKGYLNPAENKKAWTDTDWFNTGDIGILDKDQYLQLTGRAKDLIIRGGHNIDPQGIEIPLEKHPAVSQAIAVGQPDAHAGEIPIVYVCLKAGHCATEDELLTYCRQHISESAAVPKRVILLDKMPLTAVGKISKPVLRNQATEYAVNHVLETAGIHAKALSAENNPQKGQVVHISLSSKKLKDPAQKLLTGFPVIIEFDS